MFCWSTEYSIYKLDMFVLVIENPGGKISNYNMYNRLGNFVFKKGKLIQNTYTDFFLSYFVG